MDATAVLHKARTRRVLTTLRAIANMAHLDHRGSSRLEDISLHNHGHQYAKSSQNREHLPGGGGGHRRRGGEEEKQS